MTVSELIRLLKKNGCQKVESGSRHDKWYSPITDKNFFVPRHPSKEVKVGTVNQILKDSGLK